MIYCIYNAYPHAQLQKKKRIFLDQMIIVIIILYHFYISFVTHLIFHGYIFLCLCRNQVKEQKIEKNVEIDVKEMIATFYFKIKTSRDTIDLLTETTHHIEEDDKI